MFAAVLVLCRSLSLSLNDIWKFSLICKDEAYEKYCVGEVSTSCSPSNISALSNIAHIPQIRARIHYVEITHLKSVWSHSFWIYCTATIGDFNAIVRNAAEIFVTRNQLCYKYIAVEKMKLIDFAAL